MIERRTTVTCPRISVQIAGQSDAYLEGAWWLPLLKPQGFDLTVEELRAKAVAARARGLRIVPLCPHADQETGECPGHDVDELSVAEVP